MLRLSRPVLTAAAAAAAVSGAPSTVLALVRGRPALEATRAAGTLLGAPTLPRAMVVHTAISLWWAVALAGLLPRRRRALWGAAAGLGIAVVDMELLGRRFPAVRALPRMPQYLDHVAFGAVVGVVLDVAEA